MSVIILTQISFKRTEDAEREPGIMINNDQLIIDANGKPVVVPIWDYNLAPYLFNVHVHLRS